MERSGSSSPRKSMESAEMPWRKSINRVSLSSFSRQPSKNARPPSASYIEAIQQPMQEPASQPEEKRSVKVRSSPRLFYLTLDNNRNF